ncbi:MAG: hypothetical protein ACOCXJ_05385 [Planctomycetota bacterium]
MSELPPIQADPELFTICEHVAEGHMRVHDGIGLVRRKMRLLLGDCTDINKISVLAVLLTEATNPQAQGVLLNTEDMRSMWQAPQETAETEPDLHMSLLVLTCLQFTSFGPRHEGAKAMTSVLDRMLPEDTNRPL